MKRKFPYITVGVILDELEDDIKKIMGPDTPGISRNQFTRLEKRGFWVSDRTDGKWRVFSRTEADIIKNIILEEYKIIEKEEDL